MTAKMSALNDFAHIMLPGHVCLHCSMQNKMLNHIWVPATVICKVGINSYLIHTCSRVEYKNTQYASTNAMSMLTLGLITDTGPALMLETPHGQLDS